MKYRIIGITAAALVLIVSCIAAEVGKDDPVYRCHQHMEEPAYEPCGSHGDEVFCSHLPLVVIDTGGAAVPGIENGTKDIFDESNYTKADDGTDYANVSVSVIDNESGNNHLTDVPAFITSSLFRVRGHSSRRFEKAPYLMKFIDENGADREIPVMGMPAHHEWALHGPYLDKSLVRNYMWYNISGEIMEYAPNVRFCEVFLNGDYRGVYVMTETISEGEECRLELKTVVKGETFTGYLLRVDRPVETDLETTRDINVLSERLQITGGDVAVRYPGKTKLTPTLAKEIELDFSEFEKSIFSYDYDDENYGYQNWIDVDNFIDYYIISEFTGNADVGNFSTYLYKEPGGKYKMCVWDFNNACNNFPNDVYGRAGFFVAGSGYYSMLFKDEEFAEKVINRYRELRKTYLSDEYIDKYIDDVNAWLDPAVQRNYDRWKGAFDADMLSYEIDGENLINRNQYTPEEASHTLKRWLAQRGEWLDENIEVLRFFGHPSNTKRWNP